MRPINSARIVLAFPRDLFPMSRQAGAKIAAGCEPRRFARSDRDVDRGQGVLVQAEGLACHAFDEIAGHGAAAAARGDCQSQACMIMVICEHGQNEVRIGEPPASLPHHAKFGRLVQSLARLERQFGRADRNLAFTGRDACGPSHGAERAPADRSWSPSAREIRAYGHDANYSD
jgi:hypothetical protein